MELYTTDNCVNCVEVEKYIEVKKLKIETKKLELKDGKYYDGEVELPAFRGFPVLKIGELEGKPGYIVGKEGIFEFLEKGYLYTSRECPEFSEPCREIKCEWFTILYRGLVPEGGCSVRWNAMLITELISKLGAIGAK